MAIDDKVDLNKNIGPPESMKKEAPSERYVVLRHGEMTIMDKRRYLLEKAMKKKIIDYAAVPKYVPS